MNRMDTKKLYLGVYTTDGKHIPIRIITLIKTQDKMTLKGLNILADILGFGRKVEDD